MPSIALLQRRDDDWWDSRFYSKDAMYIKWGIFLGLLGLIFGFILFSYIHAGRRLKAGLEPLAYHRWTVTRRRRRNLTGQEPPVVYAVYPNGPEGGYYMHSVPPPVYAPGNGPPPVYPGPPKEGEAGGAQGHAGAQQTGVTGDPPAYPPPAAGATTNVFR